MTTLETHLAAMPSRSRLRLSALLYSATIFLSALLLFCIEPMFSKMVLPVLGGSSAVWSIAMVVFQGLLLAGYVYAWALTSFLPLGRAMTVHLIFLVCASFCLPVAIAAGWGAPPQGDASLWLIGLFLASIGLPFFVIAANAPLLQAWFARTGHANAANPYFLYRASNLGSFVLLLAYPFLIEPVWGLTRQSQIWSAGYALLALGITGCALLCLSLQKAGVQEAAPIATSAVRWQARVNWMVLGFIPSGLLVAVTAHIATDVASAPFLWIAPLAIYLLTFVFAFVEKPTLPLRWLLVAQPICIAFLGFLFLWGPVLNWAIALLGHLLGFFVSAMICQTLLFRRRPPPAQLTQFYVWMSVGGVLGGTFAALVAPHVFSTVAEYPLLLLLAFAVRSDVRACTRAIWLRDGILVLGIASVLALALWLLDRYAPSLALKCYAAAVIGAAALLPFLQKRPIVLLGIASVMLLVTNAFPPGQDIVFRGRSFFGVYRVLSADNGGYRLFLHGTTTHGAERVEGPPEPLAYYYRGGALGHAIAAVQAGGAHRVAAVGLGIGALACYAHASETWTFYEIDPLVVQIARDKSLFRSFSACAPNAPVVIGDARLTLRAAKPGYDLLIMDAFTSDSVPVHLLTREAFALYKSKLSPHGVLVFHISNRNLELADVVAASASANGLSTAVFLNRTHRPPIANHESTSEVAVVAHNPRDLSALGLGAGWQTLPPDTQVWTDDYSNILGALMQRIAQ